MDQVLLFIRQEVSRVPQVTRVILYGSRARGDHHIRSDYDIAIDFSDGSDAEWSALALHLRDNVPTLCGIDLLRLGPALDHALTKRIEDEGVLIYERK